MPSAQRSVATLADIPNIGPAMAGDLRRLGITRPEQLAGADPLRLYDRLARLDGRPHDPCVIDAFMAAVDYMEGGRKKAWWKFTSARKAILAGQRKNRVLRGGGKARTGERDAVPRRAGRVRPVSGHRRHIAAPHPFPRPLRAAAGPRRS